MKTIEYFGKQYLVEDEYNWIATDITKNTENNEKTEYFNCVYVFTEKPTRYKSHTANLYNFREIGETFLLKVFKTNEADFSDNIQEISKLIINNIKEQITLSEITIQLEPFIKRIYDNNREFFKFFNLPGNVLNRVSFGDKDLHVVWRHEDTTFAQTNYICIENIEDFFKHLDKIENEKV
jgi:hypothetical protein